MSAGRTATKPVDLTKGRRAIPGGIKIRIVEMATGQVAKTRAAKATNSEAASRPLDE